MPLFYRLIDGDIREIRILELTIISSGFNNIILVGDKGFTSELKIEITTQSNLHYILPLKRNSSYIDYASVKTFTSKNMDGYFKYKERFIWYKEQRIDESKRVIIFLDEALKLSEEKDYLERIEKYPEEYKIEVFFDTQHKMGTMSIIACN